ncbi:MAG TPA: MMPL family transporter [Christensenellaceae bacterium]|jgi:predicted RND superfamily exporter protein|nr:MMPL family transporter [Christensenellaceae bacterium]
MRSFSRFILKHRKLVIGLTAVLCIISFFGMLTVDVDYDMANYLPDDSPTKKALDVIGTDTPNLRFYVPDVPLNEAVFVKEKILACEHILGCLWLDDTYPLQGIPLETVPSDTLVHWYADGGALYQVTVDPSYYAKAFNNLKELYPDSIAAGNAANQARIISVSMQEIARIIPYILPIVIIILIFATSNYFEPLLFLLAIGVAILLNEGSNYFLGKVSFVTRASSAVLQLAVSIDYAVFLLHRFAEYREKGYDNEKAMEEAMVQSASSIASSAMTTVFGFLALMLMEFKIGKDMGGVLAKGVLLSYLSVMILLPAVAISYTNLIDKTTHKPFMPSFTKFSKWVIKRAAPLAIILLILIPPAFLGQQNNTFIYGSGGMHAPDSEVKQQANQLDEMFGQSQQMLLLVNQGDMAKVNALSNELKDVDYISTVISYPNAVGLTMPPEIVPKDLLTNLRLDGYDRIILAANTNEESSEAFKVVEQVREITEKHYGEDYLLVGENVANLDMKDSITSDSMKVLLGGLLAIGVVLLINFRSLSLPLILLTVIEGAVWINLSLPYFTGQDLNYIGYQIVSSVQLGATVDYGILLTQRYLEARRTMNKRDAAVFALSVSTGSILPPTLILTSAGLLLGVVSSNGIISQMGTILGIGTALSAFMVLILLPHLLVMFDKLIQKTTYEGKEFLTDEKA